MGLPLVMAGIQAGLGVAQGISGLISNNRARKSLEELQKNREKPSVPAALQKYANEPISARYRQEARRVDQQGLGAAVAAAQKTGASGMIPGVVEGMGARESARNAQYDQARTQALNTLGNAQRDVQMRNEQNYRIAAAGAQRAAGEGRQNMWMGLGNIARGAAYGAENWEGNEPTTPPPAGGGGGNTFTYDETAMDAMNGGRQPMFPDATNWQKQVRPQMLGQYQQAPGLAPGTSYQNPWLPQGPTQPQQSNPFFSPPAYDPYGRGMQGGFNQFPGAWGGPTISQGAPLTNPNPYMDPLDPNFYMQMGRTTRY